MYIKRNLSCGKCEALKVFGLEEKGFDLIYKNYIIVLVNYWYCLHEMILTELIK